jgi:hypothetical protein
MSNLSVRLPWYSFSSLFSWCGIVVLAAISPFAGWGLMWVAGFLIVLWLIAQFGAAIELTGSAVVFRVWPFGRKTAQRDQIRAMHMFAYFVSFEDPQKTKLLKIATFGWTRWQWLDVSEALGVPLYDHRTKMGFGHDVRQGRLMQRPRVGAK